MHGIWDSAEDMIENVIAIEEEFHGIYVRNNEIGNGFIDSIFMDIPK